MEISLTSLGSSQTLPLPHLRTLAARRFCNFSDTIFAAADKLSLPCAWWCGGVPGECGRRRKGLKLGYVVIPDGMGIRVFLWALRWTRPPFTHSYWAMAHLQNNTAEPRRR